MMRVFYAICLTVAISQSGCGGPTTGPPTVPVSGAVFLDGTPVADLEVHFVQGPYTAYGRTDAQGRYRLVTGAAVGENKVFFQKFSGDSLAMNPADGMDAGQFFAMQDPAIRSAQSPRQLIPPEYSDPAATKVQIVVPEGGGEALDFQLQSH